MVKLGGERGRHSVDLANLAAWTAAIALLGAGLLSLAHNINQSWDNVPRDAFVTLRYSWNLARGDGPVFTPGAPPSEGYPSFLWMLCLAIPTALRIHMPMGMDVLGVAMLLGMAATLGALALLLYGVAHLITKGAAQSTRILCAACAGYLFCLFPPTAIHAVSGAETALHAFLVTLLVALTLRGGARAARWNAAVPIAALLVCWNRSDGILPAAACIGWTFFSLPLGGRRAFARQCAVWFLAPGLIDTIWRYVFYQYAAPPFTIQYGGYAGEHINDDWRLVYPYVPALLLFAGVGLGAAVSFAARGAARPWSSRALIAACAALSIAARFALDGNVAAAESRKSTLSLEKARYQLTSQFVGIDGAATVALGDASIIGYQSRLKVIDTHGTCDAHLARYGHDAAYVLDQKPDYLVVVSQSPHTFLATPGMRYEDALYRLAMTRGYQCCEVVSFSPRYNSWVLASTPEAGKHLLCPECVSSSD
jgi:hypothetical protein